jgi:endonuclease/exonuclease/phosphatase family metal-dependent hydrolase
LFSQHAFLEIVPDHTDVRIFGVHLSAVHAAWTERRRVRELRSLLGTLDRFGDHFRVVLGDFNTLSPNEQLDMARLPYRLRVLVWLSGGRIRWQTIAIMLGADYIDAFRAADAAGSGYTFPTWDPHLRLDYAFLPKRFADRLAHCSVVSQAPDVTHASDHLPLRIEFHC